MQHVKIPRFSRLVFDNNTQYDFPKILRLSVSAQRLFSKVFMFPMTEQERFTIISIQESLLLAVETVTELMTAKVRGTAPMNAALSNLKTLWDEAIDNYYSIHARFICTYVPDFMATNIEPATWFGPSTYVQPTIRKCVANMTA